MGNCLFGRKQLLIYLANLALKKTLLFQMHMQIMQDIMHSAILGNHLN